MLSKVQEAYQSSSPQPSVSPSPPFSRFIRFLRGTDAAEAKEYWKKQFDGLEAQQFPRMPGTSFEPLLDRHISVDMPLVRNQTGSASAFTTGTLLKTAWALVLSRYTGAPEALFGLIQAGRNAPVGGVAQMLGPTVTTVPLRVKIDPTAPLTALLQSVQDQATGHDPLRARRPAEHRAHGLRVPRGLRALEHPGHPAGRPGRHRLSGHPAHPGRREGLPPLRSQPRVACCEMASCR